ncbi:MAG: replication factor C small subunit [Cuniculiplasma sp.]
MVSDKDFMEIWIEKHRPEKVSDVAGQKEAVKMLEGFVKSGEMPHLIFAGPPGVGKTTMALCLAREMLGENWKDHLLELNASNERGIDVIKNDVKEFARNGSITEGKFKIIFFDESDQLTPEAQAALRRTMEIYYKNVRFIFSCNYSSGIIPPIQSRCVITRFKKISMEDMVEALDKIAVEEKMKVDRNVLEAIFENSDGDLRKAVNILQSISFIENPTVKDVYDVSGSIDEKEVVPLLSNMRHGNFEEASRISTNLIVENGFSAIDIIKALHRLITREQTSPIMKRESFIALADTEFRLAQGGSDHIQLDFLVARMCKLSTDNL